MELDEAQKAQQGQLTDDDLLESPASPPVQHAAKRAASLKNDEDLLDDGSAEPLATGTISRHDAESHNESGVEVYRHLRLQVLSQSLHNRPVSIPE